jgi:hypothetical protein
MQADRTDGSSARGQLARGTPASFFVRERRRAWVGLAADLLSALVALGQPVAGLVVAALLPVFHGLTNAGLGSSSQPARES